MLQVARSTPQPFLYNSNYSQHVQQTRSSFKHALKGMPVHQSIGAESSVEMTITSNGRMMQRVQVHTPAAMIGRGQSADIVLNSPAVSRQHARLSRVNNEYWLIDLGSTNGTKVNGQTVQSVRLRDGDVISIGSDTVNPIEIQFQINN